MENKINTQRFLDVSEIVEGAIHCPSGSYPPESNDFSVLAHPILLNELCDIVFPGL